MKNKWNQVITLIAFIVLSFPVAVLAQPDNTEPDPNDVEDVPLDGGVTVLLAAGVAYGVKKVRDSRKKEI